ncbi:MAG: hypothetical protein IJW45_02045 [Oscillospiraceae bacterium]|nr:hypothetical protein [Oscillospiraceae bacterium]
MITYRSEKQFDLKIRVFENGELQFEETIHDLAAVCELLRGVQLGALRRSGGVEKIS